MTSTGTLNFNRNKANKNKNLRGDTRRPLCIANGTLVLDLSKAQLVSGTRYAFPNESTWVGALRMGEGKAAAFTLTLPKKPGSLKVRVPHSLTSPLTWYNHLASGSCPHSTHLQPSLSPRPLTTLAPSSP